MVNGWYTLGTNWRGRVEPPPPRYPTSLLLNVIFSCDGLLTIMPVSCDQRSLAVTFENKTKMQLPDLIDSRCGGAMIISVALLVLHGDVVSCWFSAGVSVCLSVRVINRISRVAVLVYCNADVNNIDNGNNSAFDMVKYRAFLLIVVLSLAHPDHNVIHSASFSRKRSGTLVTASPIPVKLASSRPRHCDSVCNI